MAEDDKLYQFDEVSSKRYKFEELLVNPETKAILRAIISESIIEGVTRAHCRLPIDDDEALQLRFFFDGFKNLGNGDIHAGMEEALHNHKHTKESRNRFARLSERVGAAVLLTLVGGLITACYKGFKFFWAQP